MPMNAIRREASSNKNNHLRTSPVLTGRFRLRRQVTSRTDIDSAGLGFESLTAHPSRPGAVRATVPLASVQAPSSQPVLELLRTADPIFGDGHVDLHPGDLIGIAGQSMPNVLDPQNRSSLLDGDPFAETLVPIGDV